MRLAMLLGGFAAMALWAAVASAAPPTADPSVNEDFKRLKSGPFAFQIDANPGTAAVDPLPVCLAGTVPDLNDNGLADDTPDALAAANAAADAWDDEVTASLFGTVDGSCAAGDSRILWGTTGQNAVAQAALVDVVGDFATKTAYVKQFEITLSSALDWEIGDAAAADSEFDAQGIMTHELGHPTGLADLRKLFDSALTMFGSASPNDLNKATLGCGDMLGVQTIYGASLSCSGAPND